MLSESGNLPLSFLISRFSPALPRLNKSGVFNYKRREQRFLARHLQAPERLI